MCDSPHPQAAIPARSRHPHQQEIANCINDCVDKSKILAFSPEWFVFGNLHSGGQKVSQTFQPGPWLTICPSVVGDW